MNQQSGIPQAKEEAQVHPDVIIESPVIGGGIRTKTGNTRN